LTDFIGQPVENGSRYERTERAGLERGGAATRPPGHELRDYLDVVLRKWWLVVASGLIALGFTWWVQRGAIPVYTAEVLLEQRGEAPLVGGERRGGPILLDFGSQAELIRSRAVAAAVMDSLGLQLRILEPRTEPTGVIGQLEVEPGVRSDPYMLVREGPRLLLLAGAGADTIGVVGVDDWVTGPGFRLRLADPGILDREPLHFSFQNRQAAIERLQRSIRVEPGRGPGLIRIHYTSPDPAIAAAVVNGVAMAYQKQRALVAKEAAGRRREVIAQQLVQMADSLDTAQEAVVEYQRTTGVDPGFEGGQLMAMVLASESEVRTLRFQESLLESLVAGLRGDAQRQDESVHRILSVGSDLVPAGPALHQRLQQLEMERSRLTASRFGRTEGDPEVEVLDSLIVSTRTQIRLAAEQGLAHLRVRLRGAEQRVGSMRADLGTTPGRTAELAQLRQRADAVQNVVDALVDRYFEAQIAEAVEGGGIAVVDPALVPLGPDRTQRGMKYLLSLLAGLMVGVLGAFGMAYLDTSVHRADDARAATGLPLLAMVPRMPPSKQNAVAAAIGKEAFRALRTNLRFGAEEEPRVLSVTSATPQEGKSTIAVNLATTLAEQGSEPVLVIDADLRRPTVHHVFGLPRKPGLTDVLQGTATILEAIRDSRAHSNLHVLPCGSPVTNAAELLGSPRFSRLLGELRTRYGHIVIDTPPVLAVTDGVVVTRVVDGTIVVVRANQTDRAAVENAMDQLRNVNASLVGVIFNAVEISRGDGRNYYRYYKDYHLGPGDDRARQRSGPKRLVTGGSRKG
jgi:polysaccharide biosynthesis transport protein